jgi:hypothetical protein
MQMPGFELLSLCCGVASYSLKIPTGWYDITTDEIPCQSINKPSLCRHVIRQSDG